MITIYVQKTQARAELDAPVTSGSVGREVQFQFSDDWDGLVKTAVFETNNYKETATVPVSGTLAIPKDVLTYPGFQLRIGAIGKAADGATVIPTVYADCSMIKPGASTVPVGTPPTPSQAEQLQEQIDKLREQGVGGGGGSIELDTTLTQRGKAADAKAVGNALDELEAKIGEGGSGGITEETDPTVPAWAKAATKPTYTAAEVGAMAADAPVVKTVNGAAPDGSGNVVVPNGADGVSATHKWNGTVLTITSASGTSSADLKGDTGAKGDKGDPGEPGASGAPGADGKTPERGVDYWTETDKAEIVAEVLAALPNAEGASF